MRSRIATVFTVLVLIAGTGGALALAGQGSSGGPAGGAATAQYKPGKGCGDKNHQHQKNGKCKKHKKKHHKKTNGNGGGNQGGTSNPNCKTRTVNGVILVLC